MTKSFEQLGVEREKRVIDAIELKLPDRVPFIPFFEFFPAYYAGMSPYEVMYDYDKACAAWKKTILDFDPDMYVGPAVFRSGPVLEALDCKQLRWPGHGVDKVYIYQFVEGEHMPPEEYDEFIENPSDWMLTRYIPRIYGALEAFKKLPGLLDQFYYYGAPSAGLATMGLPEVQESFQAMLKAARESHKFVTRLGAFINEMKEFGYSPIFFVATYAAMDLIGDNFRGTRGVMLDMYRRPEKLLKALDVTTKLTVRMATRRAVSGNIPVVFIPLHKGAEGFMSLDQFKTFYWPSLKSLINGIINAGLIPWVYTEGGYTSRLEVIRDIPKGKAIFHFENVDMRKAKEVLGDVACISGNVPLSLLISGTSDDVIAYCKELIETVGKGGGFIMDAAATIDEAKVENIRAMAEATRTYGAY